MSRDDPHLARETRESPPPATDPTAIGPPPAGAEVAPDGAVTSGLPTDDPSDLRSPGNVPASSGLGSNNKQ